ncbi:MAG: rRNA cytosine-C5-methyltransferase [Bacteroidales bacterium]|nr:rRNA cytosine-C5-methyltransferase [Bacteroidales bacterium]
MEEASVSIRLNPFKGLDGPAGTPVPWSPYGRILSERPVFTLDPLFHAGCYYVQDSSAMYVGHLFRKLLQMADDSEGAPVIRVLDLCAAPGGKTTDLAASLRELCGDDFLLVANEVMKARVGVLDDNVARWGDPNVVVTSVDPVAFAQLRGYFDIIVADVPCSGEGMFRKDPRAREEWSPAVVDLCAARQKRILADVWPSLREGGWLLYSTCTYEAAENDENLAWAAAELGGEILEPEAEFEEFGVRRTPHGHLLEAGVVPGEGQWAGALRKTAPQPAAKKADVSLLRPLRPGGVRKGEMKGKDFVPDADYALSIVFDRNDYRCVDVDRQTALRFLHRDALVLPQAVPGYNVITYLGHPLGFVKNIGSRCNNLLPKARRILMNV